MRNACRFRALCAAGLRADKFPTSFYAVSMNHEILNVHEKKKRKNDIVHEFRDSELKQQNHELSVSTDGARRVLENLERCAASLRKFSMNFDEDRQM